MAKTVIVSEQTIRQLVEAHASMAAWYYQMSEALRRAGAGVEPPSDEQRAAYVRQLGTHFPELSAVAQSITAPRPYIPPPAFPAPARVKENEGVEIKAPPEDLIQTPAYIASSEPEPPAAAPPPEPQMPPPSAGAPPPPAIVDPSKVKY